MLKDFKKEVFNKLKSAELNITDNGAYEEKFPWVMMRLSDYNRSFYLNVRVEQIMFTIDIFSTYNGEEEIIDTESKITSLLKEVAEDNATVVGWGLKNMKIMDDKAKGPVAKHGVLTYRFILAAGDNDE